MSAPRHHQFDEREPREPVEPKAVKELMKEWFAWAYRTILIGIILLACWQGKNMVNSAIAQSPALAEVKVAADNAKVTADTAKLAADQMAAKVDQLIAGQARVFQSLQEAKNAEMNETVAVSALTQHVSDIKDQLDRVESRQEVK